MEQVLAFLRNAPILFLHLPGPFLIAREDNHHADHGSVPDDKENILKRDFETETVNQKWCTDITYIHILKEGWTYPASMMDLRGRKKFSTFLSKILGQPPLLPRRLYICHKRFKTGTILNVSHIISPIYIVYFTF